MRKEERAFRRLITETMVEGSEPLTRREIHSLFGISEHMVSDARRAIRDAKSLSDDTGLSHTTNAVSNALKRKRKTAKFFEKRDLIRKFYEEKSMPTSRRRDVVNVEVSYQQCTQ